MKDFNKGVVLLGTNFNMPYSYQSLKFSNYLARCF